MKIGCGAVVRAEFYLPLDEEDRGRFSREVTPCMARSGQNGKRG